MAAIAALVTLLSAVQAYRKPADRRHLQHQSSQEFSQLMLQVVRCETETEYEKLWEEYNKGLSDEPFPPQKFEVKEDFIFSSTRTNDGCSWKIKFTKTWGVTKRPI